MIFENIEKLKHQFTDKYVVVDESQPELKRFHGLTGAVKTVNMSGRALVEFDGYNSIGWYDIDPAYLRVVPAPEPKPAESAKPEDKKPEETKPAETTERDPKAALKEKQTSQTMLERGKLEDAIAAGEKSVQLDPTDAEAWLILGAAYQQKRDTKEANRAFKACLEQATRGPKNECRAFAH